ncbi:hypothetical protein BGP77_04310 [Saccharospirillum sp. MSK14-1]|nr:hypothetical protein BGP77_04310 [Saccharospirillum sp. MSK14-1]
MGALFFVSICAFYYYDFAEINVPVFIMAFFFAIVCGFCVALSIYPFQSLSSVISNARVIGDEPWQVSAVDGALMFRKGTAVSSIRGDDITAIKAKFKGDEPVWFDVFYNNQRTRVQFESDLATLYQHTKNISNAAVEIIK